MVIKKQEFGEDEVVIFDDAIVYKRGDYRQFRMWLRKCCETPLSSSGGQSPLVRMARVRRRSNGPSAELMMWTVTRVNGHRTFRKDGLPKFPR